MKSQLSSIEAAGCCISADADDEADRPKGTSIGDSPLDHFAQLCTLSSMPCTPRFLSQARSSHSPDRDIRPCHRNSWLSRHTMSSVRLPGLKDTRNDSSTDPQAVFARPARSGSLPSLHRRQASTGRLGQSQTRHPPRTGRSRGLCGGYLEDPEMVRREFLDGRVQPLWETSAGPAGRGLGDKPVLVEKGRRRRL